LYGEKNYIQFVKDLAKDSTTIAFLYAPGATEVDSLLIVKMTGMPYAGEKPYRIAIDTRFTTAVEGKHFNMPERTTFQPGKVRDTLAITFYRTDDMKTQAFRLVLRVEPNETFQLGQAQYQYKVFLVHDKISQPGWWDGTVTSYYLGTYSDWKFQKFIDVTGIADLSQASSSELRANALKLKYWLDAYKLEHGGEPFREENGDEMKVPING
jgi:hypothetical protein